MKKDESRQQYLAALAEGVLSKFSDISRSAREVLERETPLEPRSMGFGNTFNNPGIIQAQVRDAHGARTTAELVAAEPAIARVIAVDENGNKRTFFINRIVSWDVPAGVIGYWTPMGRLASVPAGEDVDIATPSGTKSYLVLERSLLYPRFSVGEWDSLNSSIERDGDRPVTVSSFRALIPVSAADITGDVLEQLLADERAAQNIVEGIRRSVIMKMSLRDRPTLNKLQDEIFRLPLNSRLLILGPPGSGKTTTLIHRLGHKLNIASLDESELRLISKSAAGPEFDHGQSWLMFTPTELLKQYVKEAFARAQVPASDQRIATWADYARGLARNDFRILRSSSKRGPFVIREGEPFLLESTLEQQIEWFDDFYSWQDVEYWNDLEKVADSLSSSNNPEASRIGRRLISIVSGGSGGKAIEAFWSLSALKDELQKIAAEKRDAVKRKIDAAINLQVNRDKTLLDQIASLLQSYSDSLDEDAEDEFLEEEEDVVITKSGRLAAAVAFGAALRAQARAEVTGRRPARDSRNAKLLEWLGDRSLVPEERAVIGDDIQLAAFLGRFLSPFRRYIDGASTRYRRYRAQRIGEKKWYRSDESDSSKISALEVDAILLLILRSGGALLRDSRVQQEIQSAAFGSLSQIQQLLRNQVLVDEATDFSPIQLACMAAICNPDILSFYACGDFNQRITDWGVRSEEEFRWAVPNVAVKFMTTTYRHSRQLNEFARKLIAIAGGVSSATLPENIDSDGVAPSLGLKLESPADVATWLAQRIGEIELITKAMPSIAVLVNSEKEVSVVAEALDAALSGMNMRAVPCFRGQVVGHESDVRVFDIQHIKGLEFEAVFFVSIDKLAEQLPKLFDRYLYVGVTRAATYLGVTCSGHRLPTKLKALERDFSNGWAS